MHKMAEKGTKSRLVRCPKCGNLLHEPPDYSVYLCGGCDAVLRAKKISSASDEFLEKYNEDDNVDGYKKLETLSEKVSSRLDSVSEAGRERDGVEHSRRKDRVPVEENVNLVSVSSKRTKNTEILIGHDYVNVRVNGKGLRVDQGNVNREVQFGDNCRQSSKQAINEEVRWRVEREGFWEFDEDPRTVPEHSGFSPSAYHDEGPSNRKPNSFYGHGEPMKNLGFPDHEPYRVENLEHDRAEILRKLNDLKEQISRLDEKPSGTIPDDRKTARPKSNRSGVTHNVSMQPFEVNHASFKRDHNLDMHKIYPTPRHIPNMVSGSIYKEPFQSQQLRRPPNQPPTRYPQQQHREYFLGRSIDFDQDLLESHSQETYLHQPACSCLHCYNKNSQIPPKVPGIGFRNRRVANYPIRSNFYHNVNPVTVGQQNYHPSCVIPPPLHSQELQPRTRWPIESDVDGFCQSRPRRVVATHVKKKFFRPIVGGAPFITCRKCFELLKLPRKLIKMANNQKKLQCGACSTVHSFEIKDKRLIISIPTETKQISVENGGVLSFNGCSNVGGINFCSVDFDHSGFNCQFADTKPNSLLEDQMLNLSESEKRQGHTSSSSISLEEEKSPNSVIVQRDISNCAELPSKDDMSPSVAGSPFGDHFNGSSSICAMSSIGKGNRSKRMDQEKVKLNQVASGKNSDKDALVETEVEISFSEYINTSLSQNSVQLSREEDQPRIKTGYKTFLAGLVKKSFRDFSRSNQSVANVRPSVSVNGQPIPDHLVKKAEQLAGPVHPGNYWYDFQAGFWGVMGQPCCGIISAFIKEFNYSMPENCAAGNTNVFVNGRELHQTDLDLLVSRGLPNMRNKNYIIEISGRVVDENTGKELDSLGKLAPTVEKVKRGFGMRVPKVAS